ncbi:MAG: ketoacyl-ACP synthase III [Actinomycetota bacterium]|nr:ketoacyl-ACP synthase III [Actinomycetota bacterium]PLS75298.1 MAG: 3-oxoacyl-ACP synthase [Actinomycetota bacterium]
MGLAVAGLGTAVPEERLTNADLEAVLDTSDDWIVERTGIRERRVAAPGEDAATLAVAAGAAAIKDAGLTPADIDLLVVATCTPVQAMPATAALVQDALGLSCGAFDLAAACSGFVYGLVAAAGMAPDRPALVIGAETLTRITDPDDRGTRILFGDGAGAAVLAPSPLADRGLLSWDLGCDGSVASLLEIPAGRRFIEMEGREVFRRAVRIVVESAAVALERAGLTAAEVDLFVPHQANVRIIEACGTRMGIGAERTAVNLDRYGNTSAASIPIALAEAAEEGRLNDGDIVLLSGFGAGMTWASAVLRWEGRS